ncbi:MAG TPA: TraY domain-containing protein [Nocardioides sp.]|jgi:predicted transcriptional regulator
MATITVRNLDDDTQRRLKQRAAANNRSMEAEARAILSDAVRVDTFASDWIVLFEPFRGEFETPQRSTPRELDLT